MSTTMQAVGVVPSRREVLLLDHPMPEVRRDTHVKVRSLEVGICGTDKEICSFVYGSPPAGDDYLVLGHESLGEVVEAGAAVTGLKTGDLVVPSVRRPCDHPECRPCRAGRQDFCETGDFTERGIKMRHGFMTEYYVEDEEFLHRVPQELRDVAVLVEPLTVAEKGIAQLFDVQKRLPWIRSNDPSAPGRGLKAVVLGAGPIGILGTMALLSRGFEVSVYSRSPQPNPKADLVESLGVKYISSKQHTVEELAEQVGRIDVIYEGIGTAGPALGVLQALAVNGVCIFTGLPAPRAAIEIEADNLMRNIVLKNQAIIGTVNADKGAFEGAIRDLGLYMERWPAALRSVITGRFSIESYRDLLIEDKGGIKNVIAMGR